VFGREEFVTDVGVGACASACVVVGEVGLKTAGSFVDCGGTGRTWVNVALLTEKGVGSMNISLSLLVPIVSIGYKQTTGHFPDFTDKSDLAILGAEVVAFANVARFALPLRIGLAITTIPWVQNNVVDRFWILARNRED
jgi:hypothetical protein